MRVPGVRSGKKTSALVFGIYLSLSTISFVGECPMSSTQSVTERQQAVLLWRTEASARPLGHYLREGHWLGALARTQPSHG